MPRTPSVVLGLAFAILASAGCSARGPESWLPRTEGKAELETGDPSATALQGEDAVAHLAQAFLTLDCADETPSNACADDLIDIDDPEHRWAAAGFALTLWAAAAGAIDLVEPDGFSFSWAAAQPDLDLANEASVVDLETDEARDLVAALQHGSAIEIGWMRFAAATRAVATEPPSPVVLANYAPEEGDLAATELAGRHVQLSMQDEAGQLLRAHLLVWQVPLGNGLSAALVHPEDVRFEWSESDPIVLARRPGEKAAGRALRAGPLATLFMKLFPNSKSAKQHKNVMGHGHAIDATARSKNPAFRAWSKQALTKLRAATGATAAEKLAKDSAVWRSLIKPKGK